MSLIFIGDEVASSFQRLLVAALAELKLIQDPVQVARCAPLLARIETKLKRHSLLR